MKRFPLLTSIAAAVIWLLPVVGPFAASARASAITTGNVNLGGVDGSMKPSSRTHNENGISTQPTLAGLGQLNQCHFFAH